MYEYVICRFFTILSDKMYLMYYLNAQGIRVYTMNKVIVKRTN